MMTTTLQMAQRWSVVFVLFCIAIILTYHKTFDDKVASTVGEIMRLYTVGLCARHPDMRCFHHKPSDLHFELTRPRINVWAAAYVSAIILGSQLPLCYFQQRGDVKALTEMPIGSALFKKEHALKRKQPKIVEHNASIPDAATPVSALNPPPISFPQQPQYGMPPYMMPYSGYAFPPVPYAHYPYPPPAVPYQHTGGQKRSYDTRSSSPVPFESETDLDELNRYYAIAKFDPTTQQRLNALGFHPGDCLEDISEGRAEQVGFLPLVWHRLVKANGHARKLWKASK